MSSKPQALSSVAQRNIDVTWARNGTIHITAPCGWSRVLPGDTEEKHVRTLCGIHRKACCRTSRLHITWPDGEYTEAKEKTA